MKNTTVQIIKTFNWSGFNFITAPNVPAPEWTTHKFPLHTGEFATRYEDPNQLLGIGFAPDTNYLMSDIDRRSPYHPLNNWARFRDFIRCMRAIGLNGNIIIRSSHSGGIHIYFPLPKYVNTFNLAVAAKVAAIDAGFEVANGKLEFFPNVKTFDTNYNRHRLPLQPNSGSIVLDHNGQPLDIPENEQHGVFIQEWIDASRQQNMRLLGRKMRQLRAKWNNRKNYYKYKAQIQPTEHRTIKAAEFERCLDKAIEIGWICHDMTQEMILNLLKKAAIFCKLTGQKLIDWIVAKAQTRPGYQEYCNHKHDLRKIVTNWVRSNERGNTRHQSAYYTPYCSHPTRDGDTMPKFRSQGTPNNPAYQRYADEAKERIKTAVADLPQPPAAYPTIEELIAAIQSKTKELAGVAVSRLTLGKNKSLWHPKYVGSIALPETFGTEPENNRDNNDSDIDPNVWYKNQNAETQAEQELDRPAISILCSEDASGSQPYPVTDLSSFTSTLPHPLEDGLVPGLDPNPIAYTQHYNLRPDQCVTRQPGKIEVLGGILGKIAALAAVVASAIGNAATGGAVNVPEIIAPEVVETSRSSATTLEAGEPQLCECDDLNIAPGYSSRNGRETGASVPLPAPEEIATEIPLGVTAKIAPPDLPIAFADHQKNSTVEPPLR